MQGRAGAAEQGAAGDKAPTGQVFMASFRAGGPAGERVRAAAHGRVSAARRRALLDEEPIVRTITSGCASSETSESSRRHFSPLVFSV